MKKNIAVFFLITFIYTHAIAQGMSPAIEVILKQTMAADGQLTKQMHRNFWKEINSLGSSKEITQLKKTLEVNILYSQEYQKELWGSAKISYNSRKVQKTQRLKELEKELPIKFEESLTFPKGSANYRSALLSYKKSMKVSMENSKRVLESASTHQPMTSAQGQVLTIDMTLINMVLMNLTSSFNRFKNLLNENWSPN